MQIPAEKLKELLVAPGYVGEANFDMTALEATNRDASLMQMLVEKGFISDDHIGQIIADHFNYHFIDLSKTDISPNVLQAIPELVARAQEAIVFDKTEHGYKLATAQPENYEFLKFLEKKLGEPVDVYYATPLSVQESLAHYKSEMINQLKALVTKLSAQGTDEGDVVPFVDMLLMYAYHNHASDIHIEPLEKEVAVRYRIDGVLHEVLSYPLPLHEKVVFRIKIMSRMRTDEHAAAQDGRFDFKTEHAVFDIRISVLPVVSGENIVMRLLSDRSRRLTLEELGLVGQSLERVTNAVKKPYGMILAVGPTGSGKTTTLYALLEILNRPEINVMTIEDPVEYDMEHVRQTQVNPKKNLTFATGLRSIVRQDPNVIMVGEIRDNETADIAVNAAMTGHLLLSTLHANDAATSFPRLIDMGIEPFLVASSVNIVVAQRLVRNICGSCARSYLLTPDELAIISADPALEKIVKDVLGKERLTKVRAFKGKGCKVCSKTGYAGRTGIFEVMEVTESIRTLITGKSSAETIETEAKRLGMTSMIHDGISKVFRGITTLEEVVRVIKS